MRNCMNPFLFLHALFSGFAYLITCLFPTHAYGQYVRREFYPTEHDRRLQYGLDDWISYTSSTRFTSMTVGTHYIYIGTKDGSLYGIAKDYDDPIRSFVSPKTKIPNLLFTGQNLNMHGVLGVTIGSIVTCAEIFGPKYLMSKIRSA